MYMMNEDQFDILVARILAGEADAKELQQLDLLLQDDALKERYIILQQYFKEAAYPSSTNVEQALQRTMNKINATPQLKPVPKRIWTWAAAAAVIISISLYAVLYRSSNTNIADNWLHRQNGKATRAMLELADGSKIWLNAESKLTYPKVFGSNSREVYLSGEAFFDVASNPLRPFIIHLSSGDVRVLGTSFNVRAYDNEPVQTSVKTGKIAFIPNHQQPDTVYVTPDEKLTYEKKDEKITKTATVAEEDKAWTEGRLIFRDMPLEDICAELERTFGKKVVFTADAPRHYRLTGAFQNNSLRDIMYYFSMSKQFHYSITDSTLQISE
jgi:transmembrane sensor